MRYHFDVMGFQGRCHEVPFVIDDACLTPLFQSMQIPFLEHMDRIKHVGLILIFFVPIASLCGVVASTSSFTKYLIIITGNI